MNRLKLFALLLLLLLPCISAYQEKMTVRECLFSYNDAAFLNYWSEGSQSGIFLNITNRNLNLGAAEEPDFIYTSYQPQRTYYNNFNYGGVSKIPMLQVKSGQGNIIYAQCRFKVGNYRIFLNGEYTHLFGRDGGGLLVTHDYNLTKGIITPTTAFYSYSTNSRYDSVVSNYSNYGRSIYRIQDLVSYFDNGVRKGYNITDLVDEGFYPNTEPIVVSTMNLTKVPSGIMIVGALIRENSRMSLIVPLYLNWFYINSSLVDTKDYLLPRFVTECGCDMFKALNLDTGAYSCCADCSVAPGSCIVLNPGNRINITYTIINDFNVPIYNNNLTSNFWNFNGIGIGAVGTGLNGSFKDTKSQVFDFAPYESKNFSHFLVIPPFSEKYQFADTLDDRYFQKLGVSSDGGHDYPHFGSDNISYLAFARLDPKIEMEMTAGGYKPVFNISAQLFLYRNNAYYTYVWPGDYNLSLEFWNNSISSGQLRDTHYFSLDQNAFISMGKTCPGSGCVIDPVSDPLIYSMVIPIKQSYINDAAKGAVYKVLIYSIKNTGTYAGLKIAKNTVVPYFSPGDIAYQEKNNLYFYSNSRVDYNKLILFNPSFYKIKVDVNLSSWSDNNNFKISSNGADFQKNLFRSFEIQPLQSYEFIFYVNATYEPWVTSDIQENMRFVVSAKVNTTTEIREVVDNFLFYLNVNASASYWFDIYPKDYSPSYLSLADIGGTMNKDVVFNWSLIGSDSGFSTYNGKSYRVNMTLVDSANNFLKETIGSFVVNPAVRTGALSFNYDFAKGDYKLITHLDIDNSIAETDPLANSLESNNYREYDIKVRSCEYDASDNSMYYYTYLDARIKDTSCTNCRCPYGKTCVPGFGICGDSAGACSYPDVFSCNDFSYHLSQGNEDMCGWKCDSNFCPPGDPISGRCNNCSEISNGCFGYNNNFTCEKDPCANSANDCNRLAGCDLEKEHYCYWDYGSNKCNFYYDNTLFNCHYSAEILQACRPDVSYGVVKYIGSPASDCPETEVKYLCPRVISLPFFGHIQILAVLMILVAYYILVIIGNKMFRKEAKNP